MRRVIQPIKHEGMIKVPYDCESKTEKVLFMSRGTGKLMLQEDPLHPLRVWVLLNVDGALLEFIDKFLTLMGFNIQEKNK